MKNKNIIILEGGNNEEHEISILTSKEVKNIIIELNYNVRTVQVNPKNFFQKIDNYYADIFFNALHGTFGEDGRIQKILFNHKLKYTHSGVKASTIAFDKHLTKQMIKNSRIRFLDSILIKQSQLSENFFIEIFDNIGAFVLKPVSSGSSYGVKLIKSIEDIKLFFLNNYDQNNLYVNHENLMIERYIKVKELTVSVIEEDKKSKAIEVTEIISNNAFFDYQAKYTKGVSKHILPANISEEIYQKCLSAAKKIHDVIGCNGISRSDFLYDEVNEVLYFLEINTQPGLTPVSLVPEQLIYNNIDFLTLKDKLLIASSCQE